MKKRISFILAVVMLMVITLSAIPVSANSVENTFSTDYANTSIFRINTADDLLTFLDYTTHKQTFAGKRVVLERDIQLNDTSVEGWYNLAGAVTLPRESGAFFRGTFDGQGHKIEGMLIEQTNGGWQGAAGMFCVLASSSAGDAATITDFTLSGFRVDVTGATAVGAVAGYSQGGYVKISNVKLENGYINSAGSQDTAATLPSRGVGAIVGYDKLNSTLPTTGTCDRYYTDCSVEKSVVVTSTDSTSHVGGIIGNVYWEITTTNPCVVLTGSRFQALDASGSYPSAVGHVDYPDSLEKGFDFFNGATKYRINDRSEDSLANGIADLNCYGENAPFVTFEGTQMRDDGAYRFVGLVKKTEQLTDVSALGFELKVGDTPATAECFKVYESIVVAGESVNAPDGYYYFTFVVTGIENTTTFKVVANATINGTPYSTSMYNCVYSTAQS